MHNAPLSLLALTVIAIAGQEASIVRFLGERCLLRLSGFIMPGVHVHHADCLPFPDRQDSWLAFAWVRDQSS